MVSTHLVDPYNTAAARQPDDLAIGATAALVIDHMLGDGMSVIDPAVRIWTAENAEALRAAIEDNVIEGPESGWLKLVRQLENKPREVVLLAAEMVWLRDLPNRGLKAHTKISDVHKVLECSPDRPLLPLAMSLALEDHAGAFLGGTGYNMYLWLQIPWFARFVKRWAALPNSRKETARTDPWAFHQFATDDPSDCASMRNALLYLAFPRVFEPISAPRLKRAIRDGLAGTIGAATGNDPESVDRDLVAIRMALFAESHRPIGFFRSPWVEMWKPTANISVPESPARPRHYWIYSPGEKASHWGEFFDEGIMAIGWDQLGDLEAYNNRDELRVDLAEELGDSGSYKNQTLALWQFAHDMAVDDVVFVKRGSRTLVGRGVVGSEYRYDDSRATFRHVRTVRWTDKGEWEHPGQAVTKTLTDITPYTEYVRRLEALFDRDAPDPDTDSGQDAEPYSPQDFLDEVYLSRPRYEILCGLVRRKMNVIVQGAPGVGKTFAARRLAYSMMGEKDADRVMMIQFHQSYGYEDFVMGYRPDGNAFSLVQGPFYKFCVKAREDLDHPYFFIIDEINRGNLSKIFGELLMLIEPDKRGEDNWLRLMYSDERFWVPENLHLIGLMNTADRSLALIDYALRRRFAFFEMEPAFASDGFRARQAHIAHPGFDALVRTVEILNGEIAEDASLGRGFRVGHSYLCSDTVDHEYLSSVVEHEIIPLLMEYWFDDLDKASHWAVQLRAAIGA